MLKSTDIKNKFDFLSGNGLSSVELYVEYDKNTVFEASFVSFEEKLIICKEIYPVFDEQSEKLIEIIKNNTAKFIIVGESEKGTHINKEYDVKVLNTSISIGVDKTVKKDIILTIIE